MEELSGNSAAEAMGKSPDVLFSFIRDWSVIENIDKALHGEITESAECTYENTKSDLKGWASISCAPIYQHDNKITGVIGTIHDISKIKAAEDKLKDQVDRLTVLNKELEGYAFAIQELSQFAFISSHQLQTPIRTISNFTKIIEEDYGKELDSKCFDYLNTIDQSAKRMSSLIDTLLVYSTIGRKSNLAACDIGALVREVLSDLEIMINSTEAVIEVGELPVIRVYPVEFHQLIQNLLSNSLKYIRKNIRPQINIRSQRSEDVYLFSVNDNGIGIDSVHSEKIFDIFQRLHYDETEYEGKGIGLAYCKKIVQLHAGKIWVDSVKGVGSTFYFTIPAL
jgi:PAS domain S-box-containing protein